MQEHPDKDSVCFPVQSLPVSLLSSFSVLCCSWRRRRASLSFLVALVDGLRLDEVVDLPASSSRVAVARRASATAVFCNARSCSARWILPMLLFWHFLLELRQLDWPLWSCLLMLYFQQHGRTSCRRRSLGIQACHWSPGPEQHSLRRKSSCRCCSTGSSATSSLLPVCLRLLQDQWLVVGQEDRDVEEVEGYRGTTVRSAWAYGW